jgi:hypothetical protein
VLLAVAGDLAAALVVIGDELGGFTYPADINAEQLTRAKDDPRWKLVIFGNLDAVLDGTGEPHVLTLDAAELAGRAIGWRYRVLWTA